MHLSPHNLVKVGFKSARLMATKNSLGLMYRVKDDRIEFTQGFPESIGYFPLSPREMKAFKAGRLTLVPPGCCAPMANQRQVKGGAIVIWSKPVKSVKHLERLFAEHA